MILQCPSCNTRFLVNSSLIPADGRDVKCAKCMHQWFVEGEPPAADYAPMPLKTDPVIEAEPTHFMQARLGDDHPEAFNDDDLEYAFKDEEPVIAAPEEVIPEAFRTEYKPSHMPVIAEPISKPLQPFIIAASVLLVCAVVSGLFAFRHALSPSLGGIYSVLGMTATDGLALADVEVRARPSRSQVRYVVEGAIMNESDQPRHVPILRIAMVDKNGEWIAMREYQDETTVKAGESYPFKAGNLETAFADKVDHLLIEIGNGTQLMLRQ